MKISILAAVLTAVSVSVADAQLVINEIHADPASDTDCAGFGAPIPSSLCGDANGDGTLSSTEDEFVEIYNSGVSSVDLLNYTLEDGVAVRHTFPSTVLAPFDAVVVFGGGTPSGTFGGGIVQTASTGGLSLGNSGDSVILKDAGSTTVTSYTYGSEGGDNQSLTRSPDLSGAFAKHFTASSGQLLYSPGTGLDGSILPVELISFEALVDGKDVVLNWSTASETNNAGFEIEQAARDKSFQRIGYVEGQGTSLVTRNYRYRVASLEPGGHRFRLKQIDFDGVFTYSPVVEVSLTVPGRFLIEPAYPNPFNPSTTVGFAVPTEQDVVVTLVSATGREVKRLFSGFVPANQMQRLTIHGSALPSGVYWLHFSGKSLSRTHSVVLAK